MDCKNINVPDNLDDNYKEKNSFQCSDCLDWFKDSDYNFEWGTCEKCYVAFIESCMTEYLIEIIVQEPKICSKMIKENIKREILTKVVIKNDLK